MSFKVAHVTSSLMRGGAEKVLYLLIKELQKHDISQVVFYFHDGPYVQEIEQLGITTHQIKGWLWRYDPIFFLRLYKALRHQKPAVIHSLLWAANVSARICGWLQRIPVISVYHNNVDQDGLIRSFFDRITLGYADHIIAVSDQVKSSLHNRVGVQSVTVIPNGIDIQEVNAHTAISRQALVIAPDVFVIGAVGRLVSVKRFDYLMRTYALWGYDKTHLVLIGHGPLQQDLKKLVVDLNIADSVSFVQDVALAYYGLFDCFVQSSYKEGVSLALLEAMSCAKPCIVMGSGYHPVITHEYDGMIVAPDNYQKLLETLTCLYDDKPYRTSLGQMAQKTVRDRFDVQNMGAHYYKVIASMAYRSSSSVKFDF